MTPIQEDCIFGTEDLKKGEDTNDLAPIKQNTILSANSQRIKLISAEGSFYFLNTFDMNILTMLKCQNILTTMCFILANVP